MFKRIISITFFGMTTGVIASLATIGFVEIVAWCNRVLWVSEISRETIVDSPVFVVLVILVPTLGGLLVGLLLHSIKEKRALTLVDTINSAQTLDSSAPLRSGLISALASLVALSTGSSSGQYGPLAHLGSTLGVWVSRLTGGVRFSGAMGTGCGVAAAIATAFNAPLAGLLFAHEVILRHYSLRTFAPITVSAATGYIFANYIFPRPPLFDFEILQPVYTPEFLVFILIGIGGAYIAIALMKAVIGVSAFAENLNYPQYLKPATAGAILGVVCIWVPEALGIGDAVLGKSVSPIGFATTDLVIIFIAKLGLTALCLGFGFAGGIFSPALVLGILFGALVGNFAPMLFPDNHSLVGVYAICGMVAVASPVMGAPLTAILIVFELTRNYDLAIAAMVSVVFANLIGYQLIGRSIFDIQLRDQGIDLTMGRDKVVMASRSIESYLSQDYVSVDADCSLRELRDHLVDQGKSEGYIVDQKFKYLGTISMLDLMTLIRKNTSLDQHCSGFVQREIILFSPQTSIWSAMEQIRQFTGESIPVIENNSEQFLGVVYESTVIHAYMDTLDKIRQEEHGVS